MCFLKLQSFMLKCGTKSISTVGLGGNANGQKSRWDLHRRRGSANVQAVPDIYTTVAATLPRRILHANG